MLKKDKQFGIKSVRGTDCVVGFSEHVIPINKMVKCMFAQIEVEEFRSVIFSSFKRGDGRESGNPLGARGPKRMNSGGGGGGGAYNL